MSEIINNSRVRVDNLKKLILELHEGGSVESTQKKLMELMSSVPYGEVVQAEEELIKEGVDREEILKHCDLHSEALKGSIDLTGSKSVPAGHPVDVFIKENREINRVIDSIKHIFYEVDGRGDSADCNDILSSLHAQFNLLMDIEKHYLRKENLLFPFLEKHEITGPPIVMWGKHDEIRSFLKSCYPLFENNTESNAEAVKGFIELIFAPTLKFIEEMIYKEEKILFPMCMDTLTELEWYEVQNQSEEIGFCLYYPETEWKPEFAIENTAAETSSNRIKFENGSLSAVELEALFNSLSVDITFVDKDDRVRFFSHGKDRIFQRPKAVLGRQVQYCHPPSSVHIVNQILEDFKSGKQDAAKFWINLHGKFVHIAYYAVRDANMNYLGTAEITQDVNEYKNLEGERRILQYDK